MNICYNSILWSLLEVNIMLSSILFQTLFGPFSINSIRETTLGANQWLSDNQRMDWKLGRPLEEFKNDIFESAYHWHLQTNNIPREGDFLEYIHEKQDKRSVENLETTAITLQPMQIRTFVIEISKK